MEEQIPQIYLVTPEDLVPERFGPTLEAALEAVPVACLRLGLATRDEARIARAADWLRSIAHERDLPVVVENHHMLVSRLGLDGVHLTDGSRSVRAVRKALGPDAIVGAWCHASRHSGIQAGEAGADYVSFGPVVPGPLDDGQPAPDELFAWWAEMIELPVVAEGGIGPDEARRLAPVVDFVAVGPKLWRAPEPIETLRAIAAALAEGAAAGPGTGATHADATAGRPRGGD